MRPEWTKEAVGTMHLYGITVKELGERLGVNPNYVTSILNGKRVTMHGKIVTKILTAIEEISNEKSNTETD